MTTERLFEIKTVDGRRVRHFAESDVDALARADSGSVLVGEVIGDDLVDPYGIGSTRNINVLLDAHRNEVLVWVEAQGFDVTKRLPEETDAHA